MGILINYITEPEKHCDTCICGKRAPVQSDSDYKKSAGSITWEEHLLAWTSYASRYSGQSAERMAERGGFSYGELLMYLGREPTTWQPR